LRPLRRRLYALGSGDSLKFPLSRADNMLSETPRSRATSKRSWSVGIACARNSAFGNDAYGMGRTRSAGTGSRYALCRRPMLQISFEIFAVAVVGRFVSHQHEHWLRGS
jgi:hypothetical protein